MNYPNPKILVTILLLLFPFAPVLAQLDSCNVFLQGNHVEVGININGAFGSSIAAPAGYHPKGGTDIGNSCYPTSCPHGMGLGFVADPDKDGWTVGTPPYFGDYFLPGTPQEGWSIEANGIQANAWNGGGSCGSGAYLFSNPGLTGSNVSYSSNGKTKIGVWEGSFNGIAITQKTVLDTDNVFFTVYVTLTNTSATTQKDIYYLRTVDPDNTEPEEGGTGFTTYNYIPYQLPNPYNRTMVVALGNMYRRAFLGLGTLDCRAKCFFLTGGLSPVTGDLAGMYTGADPTAYTYTSVSYTDTLDTLGYNPQTGRPIFGLGYVYFQNDVGIGLAFALDSLAPGESSCLAYAYILREGDINKAFESTKPQWQGGGDTNIFSSQHDLSVCRNSWTPVSIANGCSNNWWWFTSNTTGFDHLVIIDSTTGKPNSADTTVLDSLVGKTKSGLDMNRGYNVNVFVGSTERTVVAIGRSKGCPDTLSIPCGCTDTIVMHLVPNLVPPPQVTPTVYYCQHDPAPKPLTAKGTSLRWYVSSTDTIGTLIAPTPKTDSVGTQTYYVSQTVNGCVSDLATITVVINPPLPNIQYNNNSPLCLHDTLRLTADYVKNATYTWSGPNGFSSTNQNPTRNNVVINDTGFYKLKLEMKGCPIQTDSTDVTIDQVVAKINANRDKICLGDSMLVSFAGFAPDTGTKYTWDFSIGKVLSGTGKGPYNVKWNNLGEGAIILEVANWRCKDADTFKVSVSEAPVISFNAPKDVCINDTALLEVAEYSLPNAVNFLWSTDGGSLYKGSSTGIYHTSWHSSGIKIVQLSIEYPQCTREPYTDTIDVHNLPLAQLNANKTDLCAGDSILLTATQGANYSYSWSPLPYFPHQITKIYTNYGAILATGYVYVKISDQYNCTSTDSLYFNTEACCIVAVPSAFTPNGDGRNDILRPITAGHHQLKIFRIVNRYGQTVFESNNERLGWDGRMFGVPQDIGVYFYYLHYVCNGKDIEEKGDVTLIR